MAINLQKTTQEELRQFIEQIERLEEEKKALSADITEKYSEAKEFGFDAKIMRRVIAMRRKSEADRQEEQSMLEVYLSALGMLNDTPLGEASVVQFKKNRLESGALA